VIIPLDPAERHTDAGDPPRGLGRDLLALFNPLPHDTLLLFDRRILPCFVYMMKDVIIYVALI
jgi:hypothetical protein